MIGLVRARRLQAAEDEAHGLRTELERLRAALYTVQCERALLVQARDFHKRDAEEWKGRAQRLIDTIGVTSGTLSAPVMGDPSVPPPSPTRQIMAAMGRQAKTSHSTDSPPSSSAAILGVDDTAARAAVAGVLHP